MIPRFGKLDVDIAKRTFDASVDFTKWKNHSPSKGQCPGAGKFANLFGSAGNTILDGFNRLEIPTIMVRVSSNPNYVQLPPRKSFFIAHAIANSSNPDVLAKVVCASGLSIDSIVVGRLLGISETLPAKLSDRTDKLVLEFSPVRYFIVDEAISGKALAKVRSMFERYSKEEVLLGSLIVSHAIKPTSSNIDKVKVRPEILEELTSIQNEHYKPYYEPEIPTDGHGNDDFSRASSTISRQIFLGGVVDATLK